MRNLASLFLKEISFVGDSYYRHKDLDYEPFLRIQLDLAKRIMETERQIRSLKATTPINSQKVEKPGSVCVC